LKGLTDTKHELDTRGLVSLEISMRNSGDVNILDLRGRSTIDGGESELLDSHKVGKVLPSEADSSSPADAAAFAAELRDLHCSLSGSN